MYGTYLVQKAADGKFVYPDGLITTLGHVDHGKTTLVQALAGVWVARHSEEIKRAMTIKLGYADFNIYDCGGEDEWSRYVTDGILRNGRCPDGSEPKFLRRISVVDVPGHEILVATMIAGAAVVDFGLLVVDATQPVPQPQTEEHFVTAGIMELKGLIVAQNKIDIVPKEGALENYKQIVKFLRGTWAEGSPIIPVSALHKVNIDALAYYLHKLVPKRGVDVTGSARLHVLRSFNINRPGTRARDLRGGVIGGTLVRGVLRVRDEIEIRPGLRVQRAGKTVFLPLITKVVSIAYGNQLVDEARPGGLVGIMTTLDPGLTKADALAGSVAGKPNTLPPVWLEVEVEYDVIERLVQKERVEPIKPGEQVMLNSGAATTWGTVRAAGKSRVSVLLRKSIAADQNSKAVLSRQVRHRWRVYAYGRIVGGKTGLD